MYLWLEVTEYMKQLEGNNTIISKVYLTFQDGSFQILST